MNRCSSKTEVISNSLKQQVELRRSKERSISKGSRAGSKLRQKFRVSDIDSELSKNNTSDHLGKSVPRNKPVMHKKVFDTIYKRFMTEKQRTESKLNKQRFEAEVKKEQEYLEMEYALKKQGSMKQVNEYVERVQKDINSRKVKVERLRQQKQIKEDKQIMGLFKPKTNMKQTSNVVSYDYQPQDQSNQYQNDDEYINFEQSTRFEKDNYNFSKMNSNNNLEVETNLDAIVKKAQKLGKEVEYIWDPQQMQSSSYTSKNYISKSKSYKTLADMPSSDY